MSFFSVSLELWTQGLDSPTVTCVGVSPPCVTGHSLVAEITPFGTNVILFGGTVMDNDGELFLRELPVTTTVSF